MAIQRVRVNSASIKGLAYEEARSQLDVEFANGDTLRYRGVSPEVWRRFRDSPSPAAFYEDRFSEEYTGERVAPGEKPSADRGALDKLFGE